MTQYKTFEDLDIWQKAHKAVLNLYKLTTETPLKNDYALCNQMRRAAISISSNIAEGHERKSHKEFSQFLNIAKASSSELRAQLILSRDLGYITLTQFQELSFLLVEINRMSAGLMKYLSSKV